MKFFQLSPRVPTCSFCHSLSCMSVLFTLVVPYSCLSLYIPLRSVSFLHSKCFPDCYCYGYAVPHSDHSCVITFCLSISFLFLNQYVLIPFVIVSFTFLRIIKTFLASVSKFRLFSLYNLRCISPYFLMLCLSYCCPFDLERFAVFCYHFDISYIFAETRNGKRVFSMVMASLCFTCATVTPSHRSTVTHLSFYHTLNFLIWFFSLCSSPLKNTRFPVVFTQFSWKFCSVCCFVSLAERHIACCIVTAGYIWTNAAQLVLAKSEHLLHT